MVVLAINSGSSGLFFGEKSIRQAELRTADLWLATGYSVDITLTEYEQ